MLMSDSEKEIMKIIWDNNGSIYISELLKKVEEKNKDWKRTTVRTFITRLIEKGFIKTERHGKFSEYIATMSENEYLAEQTKSFVNNVFGGNIKNLLSSLIQQDTLKSKEIDELKKFWEENKGDIK